MSHSRYSRHADDYYDYDTPFSYASVYEPFIVVMRQDGRYFYGRVGNGTHAAAQSSTTKVEWRVDIEEASNLSETKARALAARWPDRCVALRRSEVEYAA